MSKCQIVNFIFALNTDFRVSHDGHNCTIFFFNNKSPKMSLPVLCHLPEFSQSHREIVHSHTQRINNEDLAWTSPPSLFLKEYSHCWKECDENDEILIDVVPSFITQELKLWLFFYFYHIAFTLTRIYLLFSPGLSKTWTGHFTQLFYSLHLRIYANRWDEVVPYIVNEVELLETVKA